MVFWRVVIGGLSANEIWGLTFGSAYLQRGLLSEFFSVSSTLNCFLFQVLVGEHGQIFQANITAENGFVHTINNVRHG